jgi:hypothetical protein
MRRLVSQQASSFHRGCCHPARASENVRADGERISPEAPSDLSGLPAVMDPQLFQIVSHKGLHLPSGCLVQRPSFSLDWTAKR